MQRSEPLAFSIASLALASVVVALVGWQLADNWPRFVELLPGILPWLIVVLAADLMPVPIWGSVELMMSFPVLLAASFVFPPYVAGLLSLVGTVDTRELRHEISASRTLFNRSNVALSVVAAGWVFEAMRGDALDWPRILPIATVALIVDVAINASLLLAGSRLVLGLPIQTLVTNVYGGGTPFAFVAGYACFGLLALILATMYSAVGGWGLIAFAIPLLLARQMFVHWKGLAVAERRLIEHRQMLNEVSSRIADERRDERLVVAAGIHDEILPPLYKVHLMGQVLRQDLASGRLLDLEADIPDLLRAAEAASGALRDLVGDLRKSAIGPGGLVPTLRLLIRKVSDESGIAIDCEASPVRGSALTHLLLYQVAREALTNIARHSGAKEARVSLQDHKDHIRMIIEDDGVGIRPGTSDRHGHFGIELMRERIELAGGLFHIETGPGSGTRVIVRVPVDSGLGR